MDQQNQEQKKKRPYYHNRRKGHGDGANRPAQNTPQATDPQPQNAQPRREGNESKPNGGRGDGHGRRPNQRPHHEARPEEGTKAPREQRDNAPEGREPKENARTGKNNRGGRGRNDRPRDNAQRDNKPHEGRNNDINRETRGDGKSVENRRSRNERNERNDRNDRNERNDRNRSHGRNGSEIAPHATPIAVPKDPEMESWFSNVAVESRSDTDFLGEKSSALRENEPLPQVELDLSDILPPIALEKYSSEKAEEADTEEVDADMPSEEAEETVEVIGVRFNKTGKIYYFAPNGNTARRGDAVIVETARGLEFGEAWLPNRTVPMSEIVPPLRPVIRLADDKDKTHNADNRKREEDAFRICLEKIKAHGLDMKLVEAQYTFDNTKLLFYFTSAGRVDFRELVKDLASVFRTRIELRQIGIRDEAKLMGGLGICGRPLCCASFLSDFTQVSIKMAKEQNLSLNSAKISGACGRLMCCLNYEYPVYCEAARNTPSVGSTVSTPDGNGTVVEANPLAGTVKVALANVPAETAPQYYRCDRVRILYEGRKHGNEDPSPTEEDTVKED